MNDSIFEKRTGHDFADRGLLARALTHSSYCKEHGLPSKESNERLEFIGDALFDAVIGVELYKRQENEDEGRLSKLRAMIVCERSLARIGRQMDIGRFISMGAGEERSGGRERESIIADAVEAVIGAIFLDAGYEEAEKMILREFSGIVDEAVSGRLRMDHKTELQELIQKSGSIAQLRYVVTGEEGPDHDKIFSVTAEYAGIPMGSGRGRSKKEAEQNAAKATIEGEYLKNVL